MKKESLIILFLTLSLCSGCFTKAGEKAFCESCGKGTRHITVGHSEVCIRCGKTNCMAVRPFTVEEYKEQFPEVLQSNYSKKEDDIISAFNIPEYKGAAVTELNGNIPTFTIAEKEMSVAFEEYTSLDYLGRATKAFGLLGKETMPAEERGAIGQIKPSGWHTVKYPDIIEDLYLYNRCHLIAFCLSGENANELNLITGTRYLNVEGMLPYEIMVANYIEDSGNHVLYRAIAVYEEDDLVAKGVQLEAYSVEDKGEGISFNVFCHNVQPGITINYATGESERN